MRIAENNCSDLGDHELKRIVTMLLNGSFQSLAEEYFGVTQLEVLTLGINLEQDRLAPVLDW